MEASTGINTKTVEGISVKFGQVYVSPKTVSVPVESPVRDTNSKKIARAREAANNYAQKAQTPHPLLLLPRI